MLSIIELCELSIAGQTDAEGNKLPLLTANETVKHVSVVSMDMCRFV